MSFKEIFIAVVLAVLISFLYTTWVAHQTGAALIDMDNRIELLEKLKLNKQK